MAECIAYVIDYSENEDFRKKCFQLLRHELEQKILSNAKCDISFVLSSIEHEELDVSNELNYPGMFDRFLFYDTKVGCVFPMVVSILSGRRNPL